MLQLPDGNIVQVGPDRFNVPEVMFQPVSLKNHPDLQPWAFKILECFMFLMLLQQLLLLN